MEPTIYSRFIFVDNGAKYIILQSHELVFVNYYIRWRAEALIQGNMKNAHTHNPQHPATQGGNVSRRKRTKLVHESMKLILSWPKTSLPVPHPPSGGPTVVPYASGPSAKWAPDGDVLELQPIESFWEIGW